MEERFVKLQELLSAEETAKKLLTLSAEEASKVLSTEYGIEFSVEELNDIMRGIRDSIKEQENGELAEEDLELVSGGGKGSSSYNFGKSVGKAAPVAVALISVAVIVGW